MGSNPTWGMDICCECCVLSVRGLCYKLITRPEESYRLWCVVVCDPETSRMRRPWPALGKKKNLILVCVVRTWCKFRLLNHTMERHLIHLKVTSWRYHRTKLHQISMKNLFCNALWWNDSTSSDRFANIFKIYLSQQSMTSYHSYYLRNHGRLNNCP
jgi:hypothetical protein